MNKLKTKLRNNCRKNKHSGINLTKRMENILPRVRKATSEWNELISCGIPENELDVFVSVLNKMAESARKITQKGEDVDEK